MRYLTPMLQLPVSRVSECQFKQPKEDYLYQSLDRPQHGLHQQFSKLQLKVTLNVISDITPTQSRSVGIRFSTPEGHKKHIRLNLMSYGVAPLLQLANLFITHVYFPSLPFVLNFDRCLLQGLTGLTMT
jgi:hypothetical protein